jgi:hypothetical protein
VILTDAKLRGDRLTIATLACAIVELAELGEVMIVPTARGVEVTATSPRTPSVDRPTTLEGFTAWLAARATGSGPSRFYAGPLPPDAKHPLRATLRPAEVDAVLTRFLRDRGLVRPALHARTAPKVHLAAVAILVVAALVLAVADRPLWTAQLSPAAVAALAYPLTSRRRTVAVGRPPPRPEPLGGEPVPLPLSQILLRAPDDATAQRWVADWVSTAPERPHWWLGPWHPADPAATATTLRAAHRSLVAGLGPRPR